MPIEIERKFLVADVPPSDDRGPGLRLRQGYLAEDGNTSVRIRITADAAILSVKAGRGLARTEVEVEVVAVDAEQLWTHTDGRRIEKTRYRIPVDGGVAELDLYEGALAGLATVEVEFDSVAAAEGFVAPAWFGRDVTGDERWTNAALSRDGRPD